MLLLHKPYRTVIALAVLGALISTLGQTPGMARTTSSALIIRRFVPADTRETFVFQVGIDKYNSPRVPQLEGCVQDVLDMKNLLIKKFNVPKEHFLTLTDGQATHDAIIAGFRKQLIENAKSHRDAIVIFQYSGHGSRVKDRTGTKADGLSSTLVPVNSRDIKGSYFDVVDVEIRDLFEELSRYTSNITFIIDACHSGNPTRGGGKTRGIPEDDRPQPPLTAKRASTRGGPLVRGGDIGGILPRDRRYVSIAAALPYELANEMKGAKNGALTFYLLKALERAKPETTYRQLISEVANAVTTDHPSQHPQVEGDIGRPVFGGSANREDPFIEIQDVKNSLITIKAGTVHGIAPETIVAVYAPDAQRLVGSEKRLVTGRVMKAEAFTSGVKLDKEMTVPLKAKVVVVSPDFGSMRTRVAVAKDAATRGSDATTEMRTQITDFLKKSTSLNFAGELDLEAPSVRGIDWDVTVRRVKFSDWLRESQGSETQGGASSPRNADRQVYCIVGVDGTRPLFQFFVELDDPNGAQKILTALEHFANQRSLRAVNNEASQLNGALKINLFRVHGDPTLKQSKDELIELPKDALDYSFDQGEIIKVEIENSSSQDLYIVLLDISTDGSIQLLYPPAGATVAIPKGGKVKLPFALKITGPAGYETYKVIATTSRLESSDFAFLEQTGVRRGSLPVSIGILPDWTTSQVNFWISEKVR